MRSSRAILYAQGLGELTSQLSELEYLRGLVEEAAEGPRCASITLDTSRFAQPAKS